MYKKTAAEHIIFCGGSIEITRLRNVMKIQILCAETFKKKDVTLFQISNLTVTIRYMVYICVYIEYTKMEGTHDKDKKRGRVRVIVAYRQY